MRCLVEEYVKEVHGTPVGPIQRAVYVPSLTVLYRQQETGPQAARSTPHVPGF